MNRRERQARVRALLNSVGPDAAAHELQQWLGPKAVNVLFSFLYAGEEDLKWRAVTVMGMMVDRLARQDMEAARVILRRLMWNLNDESGGIGWGSPEAMGEILAQHDGLAREYASILVSYARLDGNFQEDERMQRGVMWGIGRLTEVRPELVKEVVPHLRFFLHSPDAQVRAHAVRIAGMVAPDQLADDLQQLASAVQRFQGSGVLRIAHFVGPITASALFGLQRS